MIDPDKLDEQKPDYVEDTTGGDDPDQQPQIGTDPMEGASEGIHKPVVHLDEELVRKHDAETDRETA